jgi:ketosteroid isomerase-like protein
VAQENEEIVRRSWEALGAGGLDAMERFWHPDIEWRAVEGAVDDVGVFRGRAKLREYYAEWLGMFEEFRVEVEKVFFAEGDRVGVVLHNAGRHRGTDAWADGRYSVVYTVRDGQIVRGREYETPAQAIEAAGLNT